MAERELIYHKLAVGKGSEFSISESKQYISYLHDLPVESFELIIKSNSGKLDLIIGLPKDSLFLARKHLYALCPGLGLIEVKPSFLIKKPTINLNFRFKRHYAYPLSDFSKSSNQSLSIFLGQLSQLDNNQAVEVCLRAKPHTPLKAMILRRRLLSNQSLYLKDPGCTGHILGLFFGLLSVTRLIEKVIESLVLSRPKTDLSQSRKVAKPSIVTCLDKLYEPLFTASLNVRIKANNSTKAATLARQMEIDLNNFARNGGFQSFKQSKRYHPDIYSASELAAFYNFSSQDIRSGLITASQFKALPNQLENNSKHQLGDLVLGINSYTGKECEVTLNYEARPRHVYITGATGSGKSTLLKNLIYQDIVSGLGLSLIDPHGDLAEEVMKLVPKNRRRDVIYFDPTNRSNNLRINLLEMKSDRSSSAYKLEADQVTENVLSIFRKLFSEEGSGGHRIEYILRNCIHTALDLPGSTIFTIFKLLNDSNYRLEAISRLQDPNLIDFWRNELGKAGDYQRVKMTAGITSKIGRLLFYEPARQVFGRPSSTLDLNKAINEKKIIICNFAKGNLGEDGSKLFATAILSKLQLVALSRSSLEPSDRVSHYLYLDEFQNYTPSVVIQMLSEARKYGLYLTMAEQSPSQQDAAATNVILANVGSLICFRTASPRDERLLLPNFDNYLTASDLNNLPAFHFYLKSIGDEFSAPLSGRTYWQHSRADPVNTNSTDSKKSQYLWTLEPA